MAEASSPKKEIESSILLASDGKESQSDVGLKFDSAGNIESTEQQKQGNNVEQKLMDHNLASGETLKNVDDTTTHKIAEKREDPDGVEGAKPVTFEAKKSMVTNKEEADIETESSMITNDKEEKTVPKNSKTKGVGKIAGRFEFFSSKFTRKQEDKSPGKLEDPAGKLGKKSVDLADARKAAVLIDKKIPVEKCDVDSDVFVSGHDSDVAAGECVLPEGIPVVPDCKTLSPCKETVRDDEGVSKKTKGSKAKESPKRVSTLSVASAEDEKERGCFSGLSPKRFYGLFNKSKSPKLKTSNMLSAAFSPIGDGKHFEVVYLGQYLPESEHVERIDYTNMAEEKIIPTFLGSRLCYDVMPTSGKVVVFSVELLVKNAFSALVSNEIKAAPLWDAGIMDFVGMLTITDFINVLKYYYITRPEDMKDIENQTIATWRRMTGVPKKFVKINGQDSLAQAAKLLIQESIHRIPVFDEKRQCVLFVLTKKRLLQFLSQGLLEKFDKTNVRTPSFFKKTIRELKIGTFEDIAVVTRETKVIDALGIFVTRNVSALPVLDKENILVDLFEKFDVFGLAKDQTYHNLEMTVHDVISKPYARETAWICTMDETLETVINKFVSRKVHRLVVIDARRSVVGLISLSDVLKFLIVQPMALMESSTVSDTILEGTEGAVGGAEEESECPVEVELTTGVAHMKIEPSETPDDPQEEENPSAED